MEHIISQLAITRQMLVRVADSLSDEQLTSIPAGFSNNILWNLGHCAVTLRVLCYKLAGLEVGYDEALVADFRKGSAPANWTGSYTYGQFRDDLLGQAGILASDFAGGRFANYQPYETSAGVKLGNINDAIAFNHFHEGLHLGYILAQRKALSA
ncbi:MAG: DinB family protein [Planctomycetota bacterium]|nr:DinB family protein [Planctomycetota bacterium]